MIPTYSRETPRAARQMPRSGDNVIREFRPAPKRVRLLVRAFDWTRLHWEAIADGVFFLVIVGIAFGVWCLS